METPHPKEIPFDVLEVVFEQLAGCHSTLAACARVSKTWTAASYKALHTVLRVGGFEHQQVRSSICPDLASFSRFLDTSSQISHFVQTLDISWPCDTRVELCAVLRQLPRLKSITFWVFRRKRNIDAQVMGADGLVWAGNDNTVLFNAHRVWVHAHAELLHVSGDAWASEQQPVLSFLALFNEVDTLFVDYAANAPWGPDSGGLSYPTSLKVRFLHLGKYFDGSSSVGNLVLRSVSSHPISALSTLGMIGIGDNFATELTQKDGVLGFDVLHLTCGGYYYRMC